MNSDFRYLTRHACALFAEEEKSNPWKISTGLSARNLDFQLPVILSRVILFRECFLLHQPIPAFLCSFVYLFLSVNFLHNPITSSQTPYRLLV